MAGMSIPGTSPEWKNKRSPQDSRFAMRRTGMLKHAEMKKMSLGTPWAEGVEGERKNLQQPLIRKWWLEAVPC
jgi:hypothetical protein